MGRCLSLQVTSGVGTRELQTSLADEAADPVAECEVIWYRQDHAANCNGEPLSESVRDGSGSVVVISPVLHAHFALPCFALVHCSGLELPAVPGVPEWNVQVVIRPDTPGIVHFGCRGVSSGSQEDFH